MLSPLRNVLLHPESRGCGEAAVGDPKDKRSSNSICCRQNDRLPSVATCASRVSSFPRNRGRSRRSRDHARAAVQTDAEIDAFVRARIGTAMHPTSTCAMGTGPEAVLDSELGVHGLSGCGLSIAPRCRRSSAANTNVPAIMIAERRQTSSSANRGRGHFDEWRVEIERVLRVAHAQETLQPIACTT